MIRVARTCARNMRPAGQRNRKNDSRPTCANISRLFVVRQRALSGGALVGWLSGCVRHVSRVGGDMQKVGQICKVERLFQPSTLQIS